MTNEQAALWLRERLANTGAWFGEVRSTADDARFEVDMPDGVTAVTVTVQACTS